MFGLARNRQSTLRLQKLDILFERLHFFEEGPVNIGELFKLFIDHNICVFIIYQSQTLRMIGGDSNDVSVELSFG
jgi:hypothetical protein